jgi:hypothetical protein
MSTASLKQSFAPATTGTKRARENDCEDMYPMFVGEEREKLIALRRETWKYCRYLGMDKMHTIHEEETVIGNEALENDHCPFTMVVQHWLHAIELGKKFQAHSMALNKVSLYGLELVTQGLMSDIQVKHFVDLASDHKHYGIDTSIRRLDDIMSEFIKALAEKRAACMCKEKKCYCLPLS